MSADGNDDKLELFKEVRFYCMGELNEKIKEALINGKAKSETYLSAMVTHAVVSDHEHYEMDAAKDVWQIPTVKPSWVEMSVACKTLLPTNAFLPFTDQVFSNVVACFSNLSKPDKTTLWALVTSYGGKCQAILNQSCTHLITPLPIGAKYLEAQQHDSIQTVAPDWIVDSIKSKETQACDKYHPKLNIVPSPVKELSPPLKEEPEPPSNFDQLSVKDTTAETAQSGNKDKNLPVTTAENQKDNQDGLMTSKQPDVLLQQQASTGLSLPSQVPTSGQESIKTTRHPATQLRHTANTAGARFNMPSTTNLRHQIPGGHRPMMSTGGPFAMANPGQQVFMSNQTLPGGMMGPDPQRSPSSSHLVMSTTQNRSPGSPRRSSSQSSGGKKKKTSSHTANRMSMPGQPTMAQAHPIGQFPVNSQAMFSPQQQMMQKMRLSGSGEHVPGSGMVEGNTGPMLGPRFGNVVGPQVRFPNSGMMSPRDGNAQHLHQQQMLQQQQMQRMALMRQTQPGNAGVMNSMDRMQPKWPRQSMEGSNFAVEQQGHQFYPHGPHQTSGTGEESQAMHQGMQPSMQQVQQGMPLTPTQNNASPHQHFNPTMINRFPNTMSPQQQQQMLFQQMQQHQNPNRFPTSTSLEAAGMSGISPFALQQGLLNADMQADNPPLVHPSLQGMSPKVATSQQSASGTPAPKKRSKPRKKTEGGDEDAKNRPRQRTSKAKKPPIPAASMHVAAPNINPMQVAPHMMLPPQAQRVNNEMEFQNGPQIAGARPQLQPNIPTASPGPHFNATPSSLQPSLTPTTLQLLNSEKTPPALLNHPIPSQASASFPEQVKNEVLPASLASKPDEQMDVEPYVPSREFINPLTYKMKELDLEYVTRSAEETVPETLFLLGCVFHITEYEQIVTSSTMIQLWKNMVEKYGGIVEDQYTSTCTHLICATCTTPLFTQAHTEGKRCVTIYWLNDVLLLRSLRVPWLVLHVPTLYALNNKPAINHTITYTNFHSKERSRVKMMSFVCGAKFFGYLSRTHTALVCKSNGGVKYDKAKSWSVPCVNISWLRDLMQSDGTSPISLSADKYKEIDATAALNGFLLDVPKAKHLLQAWKNPIVVTQECLLRARVKHKFDPLPAAPTQPKRFKADFPPQPLPRVCFTGLPPSMVQDLTRKLESLNGRVENTYGLCTHLVAKNVARTVKFLSCISTCSYAVTPDWIEDSFKSNWLLDESKYALKDKIAEETFKFSLHESIKRANTAPLFKDCLFCISSNVNPKKEVLKQIIECGGGQILNKIPALSVLNHLKARQSPDSRIIIISSPNDEKFNQQLKKEGLAVHNPEIVLTGVLKQHIDTESYRL